MHNERDKPMHGRLIRKVVLFPMDLLWPKDRKFKTKSLCIIKTAQAFCKEFYFYELEISIVSQQ